MIRKLILALLLSYPAFGMSEGTADPNDLGEGFYPPGTWRMYQHVGGGGLLDGRGRYISYLEIEERNGEAYQWLESHEIGVPSDLVRRRLVLHGAPWKPAIAEITQYTFSSPGPAPRPWAEPKKLRTVSSEASSALALAAQSGVAAPRYFLSAFTLTCGILSSPNHQTLMQAEGNT